MIVAVRRHLGSSNELGLDERLGRSRRKRTERSQLEEIEGLSGFRPLSVARRCLPDTGTPSPSTSCRRWCPPGSTAYQAVYSGGICGEPEDFVRWVLTPPSSIGTPAAGLRPLSSLIGSGLSGPQPIAGRGADPSSASVATSLSTGAGAKRLV